MSWLVDPVKIATQSAIACSVPAAAAAVAAARHPLTVRNRDVLDEMLHGPVLLKHAYDSLEPRRALVVADEQGTTFAAIRGHDVVLNKFQQRDDAAPSNRMSFSRTQATLRGHPADVTAVAFSCDGSRLYAGDKSGTVVCWSVTKALEPVQPPKEQLVLGRLELTQKNVRFAQRVTSLSASADGLFLAATCGVVAMLLDAEKMQPLEPSSVSDVPVDDFCGAGVTAGRFVRLDLLHATTGGRAVDELLCLFTADSQTLLVCCARLSIALVSVPSMRVLRVLDLTTPRHVPGRDRRFPLLTSPVVAASSDARLLALADTLCDDVCFFDTDRYSLSSNVGKDSCIEEPTDPRSRSAPAVASFHSGRVASVATLDKATIAAHAAAQPGSGGSPEQIVAITFVSPLVVAVATRARLLKLVCAVSCRVLSQIDLPEQPCALQLAAATQSLILLSFAEGESGVVTVRYVPLSALI